jgi:hypothetical protein
MVQQTQSNGKVKRPRPMSLVELLQHLADGGEVRRGTAIKRAFPEWEWQAFKGDEFARPVDWRAVNMAVDGGSLSISGKPGINR